MSKTTLYGKSSEERLIGGVILSSKEANITIKSTLTKGFTHNTAKSDPSDIES